METQVITMTKDEAILFVIDVLENHVEDPRSENLIEKTIKLCKEALEQPAQEPVGYTTKFDLETACQGNTLLWFANKNGKYNVALYTHPHQWQGLTDDEIETIIEEKDGVFGSVIRAIEQALKEKNCGMT